MLQQIFDPANYPEYASGVPVMVVSMLIGIILAALISLYHKYVLGSFVRFLLDSNAVDEGSAVRLADTKFSKNPFIISAIKNGRTYGSVLHSVAPDNADGTPALKGAAKRRQQRGVLINSSYYIPEHRRFRADNIFSKKGTSVLAVVVGAIIFTLAALALLVIIPDLMTMVKNTVDHWS